MNNRKRYIISHRSTHHAQRSGYSILCDHVDGSVIPDDRQMIPYKIRKWIAKRISPDGTRYDTESVRKELQLMQAMLRHKGGLAHFLNGERDIHFSPLLKKLMGWKFIATFHKPPSILANGPELKYIKYLDGAIAVGTNQVDYLKGLGIPEVRYIPHGVDTGFFTPDSDTEVKKGQFLFVGQHLRDFELLGKLLPKLRSAIPGFRLITVMRKDTRHMAPNDPSIEFRSDISDEELRNLYRSSVALLLPLLDCTACNSILEAMASGCPVITTDLECTQEYGLKNRFNPNETDKFIEASINLNQSDANRLKTGLELMALSGKYNWKKIGEQVEEYYDLILSRSV